MAVPRQSDTRQRLLDGFSEQLLERGYAGVSLDQIASASGIRKASLYHHFPGGKEAICTEVSLRYIEQSEALLDRALATDGGLAAKLRAIVEVFATADAKLSLMGQRVYDATRHLSEENRVRVSRRYCEALLEPVTALMAGAVSRGELRQADPGFLSAAFLELAAVAEPMPEDVAMPAELRGGPAPDPARISNDVVALFLNGAAGDPGAAGDWGAAATGSPNTANAP
jgi:AcrR family transcriptional regulator